MHSTSIQMIHRGRPGDRTGNDRSGTVTVEMALVGGVFFMVLLAGIEFAHLHTIRSTAHNAAYEACRLTVIPGGNATDAITEAQRLMSIVGVRRMTVAVTPSTITQTTPEVTVTVSAPYVDNAMLPPMFTRSLVVSSTVTMATERYNGWSGVSP